MKAKETVTKLVHALDLALEYLSDFTECDLHAERSPDDCPHCQVLDTGEVALERARRFLVQEETK